ncbi:hypothetical protein D3C83_13840 [compost metagenome]
MDEVEMANQPFRRVLRELAVEILRAAETPGEPGEFELLFVVLKQPSYAELRHEVANRQSVDAVRRASAR